jgi:hypothetical protein
MICGSKTLRRLRNHASMRLMEVEGIDERHLSLSHSDLHHTHVDGVRGRFVGIRTTSFVGEAQHNLQGEGIPSYRGSFFGETDQACVALRLGLIGWVEMFV